VKVSKGAGVQGCKGELTVTSPLPLCSSAPLLLKRRDILTERYCIRKRIALTRIYSRSFASSGTLLRFFVPTGDKAAAVLAAVIGILG